MKKLVTLLFVAIATFVLSACTTSYDLVIFLPNDYINTDVIAEFEREHGVRVGIINFDSNEIALNQVKNNSYDIVIPSDYAIEELAAEGYLQELDWNRIEFDQDDFADGLKLLLEELEEDGFDYLKYAMPYFWGTVGLIYNGTVDGLKEQVEAEGWAVLADPNLDTMIYDSSRDAFMAALGVQEISLQEATEQDIIDARIWLTAAKGSTTWIKSDEILDEAIGRTPYDVAMVYSGDAVYIMMETEEYEFFAPEYTNVWADGFVIPENANNVDLAYDFINFMSSEEAMIENAFEIAYTPVSQAIIEELLEDEDFADPRVRVAFDIDPNDFLHEAFRYNTQLKPWLDREYPLFLAG